MNRRSCRLAVFLSLMSAPVWAQLTDSLRVIAGTTGTLAGKDYQPLWLLANRFGTITDQKADLSTHIGVSNTHVLTRLPAPDTTAAPAAANRGLRVAYGLDLYNNNHFRDVFVREGYVKLSYKHWQLRSGRYAELIGETDAELSSGSLGVSNNALPIPKVGIAVVDYTKVPFTGGWVQFKGRFSHGWLGKDQHVRNAFLHEKSFYLQIGKGRLTFYGGLNHFALWGGVHPLGPTPGRFRDYLRIVAGARGDGADPVYQQGPIDIANAVGNHIIIPDFGVAFRAPRATLRLYTQNIFEKGKGRGAFERDRLDGLKIFGRDRLLGLSWESTERLWLRKVVLEAIYTKHQGGPVVFEGRDNYYNNAVYATGWEYQRRIIGTPLFISKARARQLSLAHNNSSNLNIISNRVAGVHVGLKGQLSGRVGYRTLATYVEHAGNYYNDSDFSPAKRQTHWLQEITYRAGNGFSAGLALGYDAGALADNWGCALQTAWTLR